MGARKTSIFAIAAAVLICASTPAARSDVAISFYLGASQTRPSDLHVTQRSLGNDATFRNVPWPGYSFRFEPYYGIRLTYTPPGHPWIRAALDYTHYKIYARTEDTVAQDGVWHGTAFNTVTPLHDHLQSFEMTHGLNMLGLTIVHSFSAGPEGVYIGAGPVIFIPHSESTVDGERANARFDFSGFGFQTVTGASFCAGKHRIFTELKYNTGHPEVSIAQGKAQTTLQTVHELAGVTFGSCS